MANLTIIASKTPDLLTSLSAEEIKLIRDYRGLMDVDRNCITVFATALLRENPRTPSLRLIAGGAQ